MEVGLKQSEEVGGCRVEKDLRAEPFLVIASIAKFRECIEQCCAWRAVDTNNYKPARIALGADFAANYRFLSRT
jgi:hypothetical protein